VAEGVLGSMREASQLPAVPCSDAVQAALGSLAQHREQLAQLLPAAQRLRTVPEGLPSLPERAASLCGVAPDLVSALLLLPEMVGNGESRVYLVLLQNSDELRPTGGFISSVIAVALDGHRVTSLQFLNSYDVESRAAQLPEAPRPLAEYMSAPGLVFRDANWSPDWPTSATVLAALYAAGHGPVDGIIAVDSTLLTDLAYAVGAIPVPKYNVILTGDNLMQVAETYWENPLEGASLSGRAADLQGWLEHRKDFGGDFIEAARDHLATQDATTWARLAQALHRGLEERHLQIWALSSETAQGDLLRAGWAGALLDAPGDYAMVVDANVGFNKVDRRIERRYEYALSAALGDPVVALTLTYTNTSTVRLDGCVHEPRVLDSYEELTQQCYWNYVRVLTPQDASLVEVRGTTYPLDRFAEAGRLSFGTLLVVPPGETRSLTLIYRLPRERIVCSRRLCTYSLDVQKQAGTVAVPLRVTTDVKLRAASVSGERPLRGPLSEIDTDLRVDRHIRLEWETPGH